MKQPKFELMPSQSIDKKKAKVLSKLLEAQLKEAPKIASYWLKWAKSRYSSGEIKVFWNEKDIKS